MKNIIAQPVEDVGKTASPIPSAPPSRNEIDAEYLDVELPSRYQFYDFKHLYIKTFKQKHIRKIIQAQANAHTRYMVEALNSVVTCELGYTDTVYRLCYEDYLYLLHWQRMHSFPNLQYKYMCRCHGKKHNERVLNKEKGWPESSLFFPEIITKAKLDTKYLPEGYKLDLSPFIPKTLSEKYESVSLHIPTMNDQCIMEDNIFDELRSKEEEGIAWFSTALPASMLTIVDNGRSLDFMERFNIVDDLSPEDAYLLRQAQKKFPKFGVKQTITAVCPRCGAPNATEVVLDAHSFLPDLDFAGNS